MPALVFDACALIAYLCDEDGAEVVEGLLLNPQNECYAHAINLCEVYQAGIREYDVPTADLMIADLMGIGIRERADAEPAFWKRAGAFCRQVRSVPRQTISLADCFAVILSHDLSAALVTADHHEMDYLHLHNLARINFIR